MLSVCFFAPHSVDHDDRQYLPQPESMHLYENETVVEPVSNTLEAWKALPSDFNKNNEARRRWRMRFNEKEKYQSMMKNYFRLISEVSESSGKIVEELERQGILNNTMIIFSTDNGYFHAEHGMAGKWYPHQESIRVPLVIKDPRMPKDKIGTVNDEFTLNIDLATTILGAAGLPQAPTMQGRDIADLYLADEGVEWRDEFFFEHPVHLSPDVIPESSALVRKDFKYMRWPGSKTEQLFDLKADPLELNDLFKSEDHQDLIAEMRQRHDELKRHAK
jgi:arylsulfatase A-like enzyme